MIIVAAVISPREDPQALLTHPAMTRRWKRRRPCFCHEKPLCATITALAYTLNLRALESAADPIARRRRASSGEKISRDPRPRFCDTMKSETPIEIDIESQKLPVPGRPLTPNWELSRRVSSWKLSLLRVQFHRIQMFLTRRSGWE